MATCNGNGNQQVDFGGGEARHVWKHLANAGLIPGNYTGQYVANLQPGVHVPASKYSGGVWVWGVGSYWMYNLGLINRNPLVIAGPGYPGIEAVADMPIFSTEDAWNIDSKMDDGIPDQGLVRGYTVTGTPQCQLAQSYNLAEKSQSACALAFLQD